MSRTLVLVVVVACVLGVALGRSVVHYAGDSDSSQGVPKVHVGPDGVSASFAGYSASAGLGGKVGESGTGGVLFARAGTPGGAGASAGLGGSLPSDSQAQGGLFAGATTGGSSNNGFGSGGVVSGGSSGGGSSITLHKTRPNTNLYNDIFNIPTSILSAVNRLLNNGVNHVIRPGGSGAHAGAAVGGDTNSGVGTRVGGGAFVESGSTGGSASAGTGTTVTKQVSTGFFNDIFNIPISALNAVNQLLNNNSNVKNGK